MQLNSITVMDLFAFGGAAIGIIAALWQFSAGAATFAAAFSIVFLSSEFFIPYAYPGLVFPYGHEWYGRRRENVRDSRRALARRRHACGRPAQCKRRMPRRGLFYDGQRQVLGG